MTVWRPATMAMRLESVVLDVEARVGQRPNDTTY